MEAKHTPGPWRVDDGDAFVSHIYASTGALVTTINAGSHINADGTDTAMTNDEYDANATLIAAAPELLMVVRALVVDYDNISDGASLGRFVELYEVAANAARAALAKAEV